MEEKLPLEPTSEIPESVSLTIEFTKEGKINVHGPVTNEMLCYYLLEKGKDIVKGHNLRLMMEEKSRITPVKGGILNFARKRF